jgi:hypothetical protein
MNISPFQRLKAKVNGLRSPSAQIDRFTPEALLKNGLSDGMLPSALIRRTLPRRLPKLWELLPFAFSPTAT